MHSSALLLAAILAAGCSRPEPPRITPDAVRTVRISSAGAEVESTLDAWNPNDEDLTASSVTTKITIGDRPDLARVEMTRPIELPAKQRVRIEVPIVVTWTDPAGLAALAATNQDAAYRVEGTVEFQGKSMQVSAPFRVEGTMTRAEILRATAPPSASGAPAASAPAPPASSSSAR